MKQFDLDLYLQNPNLPLVTRDGCKARILCTNRANAVSPIVALVQKKTNKIEEPITYYEDGRFLCSEASPYDLFFADYTPGRHEGWINLALLTPEQDYFGNPFEIPVYETATEANKAAKRTSQYYLENGDVVRYRQVKIEWEE